MLWRSLSTVHSIKRILPNTNAYRIIHTSSRSCIPFRWLFSQQYNKFDPKDTNLDGLLKNNREWAERIHREHPNIFEEVAKRQQPKILWIGCSDSRVPAEQIAALAPGELFVHRNIANVVPNSDLNVLAVIQYAVEVLKVEHIVVCGHTKCGGVSAAMQKHQYGLIDHWLINIKDVYQNHHQELDAIEDKEKRESRLVELNVMNSVRNVCHTPTVQNAWAKGRKLEVHSWVYDITKGLVNRLEMTVNGGKDLDRIYSFYDPEDPRLQ